MVRNVEAEAYTDRKGFHDLVAVVVVACNVVEGVVVVCNVEEGLDSGLGGGCGDVEVGVPNAVDLVHGIEKGEEEVGNKNALERV